MLDGIETFLNHYLTPEDVDKFRLVTYMYCFSQAFLLYNVMIKHHIMKLFGQYFNEEEPVQDDESKEQSETEDEEEQSDTEDGEEQSETDDEEEQSETEDEEQLYEAYIPRRPRRAVPAAKQPAQRPGRLAARHFRQTRRNRRRHN